MISDFRFEISDFKKSLEYYRDESLYVDIKILEEEN